MTWIRLCGSATRQGGHGVTAEGIASGFILCQSLWFMQNATSGLNAFTFNFGGHGVTALPVKLRCRNKHIPLLPDVLENSISSQYLFRTGVEISHTASFPDGRVFDARDARRVADING
jgi:hypothetical protein